MSANTSKRSRSSAAGASADSADRRKTQKTTANSTEREFTCWLFKSEPNPRYEKGEDVSYSLDRMEKDNIADWDGVRNYQARNLMRDDMKVGDCGFFYHSNCKEPGIVGIVKVVKDGYPGKPQKTIKDAREVNDDASLHVQFTFARAR
eukprot:gb/GECG01003674.1/.p1 GENE.gb/GECG01003674.1/~~gb/GECG01003674.1/.p1  ORF type:complete len:148 (+),score=12.81 gb/GECG01003674.1/:1-444(+)